MNDQDDSPLIGARLARHLLRLSETVVPVKSDWNAGLEMTLSAQRQLEREMSEAPSEQPYAQVMKHVIAECRHRKARLPI
ncbi:hypothetical protein E4Z66_15270 [Aliishimia ponticola]|uniref:Uncharacterized protein n=1 Tax=Aliishimia ponticola TaxID=2499833 RepID=A0A4V3XK14_9RHOB|nr:hypothetical protein [Aliishimia ponticola]THH35183.1 hypothetical protein E4Z66_15270 [Aliishimia ponticola]